MRVISHFKMVHTVLVIFKFLEGKKKECFEIWNGPDGISVTRGWEGCQSIEVYESAEDPNQVFCWQKWADASNYASYLAMRTETGLLAKILEMTSEVQILPLASIDM